MKKQNRKSSSVFSWQGHKDLNPGHVVLETTALPTELYPSIYDLMNYTIN